VPEVSETKPGKRVRRVRVGRVGEAKVRVSFVRRRASEGLSQRQFARETSVPRTTLQYWLKAAGPQGVDSEVAAFFETPAGVVLLHHIVLAAHLVVCWMGAGGIRLVCMFLVASGLAPFVAHSYGSQQGIAAEIQAELVAFGQMERTRLQAQMAPRKITACEDETFLREGVCLVAQEPVSGYVLVEEYVERRDAETWGAALERATAGMPVEVEQVTSDEGKALLRHARDLGAHHSPDVFHVQHEVCGALALPMLRQEQQAQEKVRRTEQEVEQHVRDREAWGAGPHGRGRPPDFDGRIQTATFFLNTARSQAEEATKASEQWRQHMRAISTTYHPFDLQTGAPQGAEIVDDKLQAAFDGLRSVAREAGLSERARAGVEKAARVVPAMLATLTWYEERVQEHVEALSLPPAHEAALRDILLPMAYLERAGKKFSEPERRDAVLDTVQRLRTRLPPLAYETRVRLEQAAALCADLFQRSSSCVEGRNGRLSQFQHALRRLTPEKQAALTVVHNFVATRPDGTTAAERFFGAPPLSAIEYLRHHVSVPARPVRPRTRPENHPDLQAAK